MKRVKLAIPKTKQRINQELENGSYKQYVFISHTKKKKLTRYYMATKVNENTTNTRKNARIQWQKIQTTWPLF